MAVMYPKNIHVLDPEDSELEVYNQLRDQLDDSYTVFYSVEWNRKRKDGSLEKSEADFIIENPKYGFLCLEVKGGSHMVISPEGVWTLYTIKYGPRDLDRSPYKQAEDSMYFFKDKYKKEYNIDYSGLFGAGAVFPFYVLPHSESISNRDSICTIESPEMNNLAEKLKGMFKAWGGARFGRNRYSQQEHEFFLDMVRKRTAMAAAAGALVKFKEKQLDEVNRVQDNYIYFLSNIRQFYVRGGAGTGKTWIALKLANSEAENGGKVLLTCKSVALASTLKGMAGEGVDVVDLDALKSKGVKGQYKNTEKEYYRIRALNWKSLSEVEAAARMIFLNKTGFNGLYRVNRQGGFNVPYGKNKRTQFCNEEQILKAAKVLKKKKPLCGDYKKILKKYAEPGDFIFLDPPYFQVTEREIFLRYTSDRFYEPDQEELAEIVNDLYDMGCEVMMTNSNHPRIYDLYSRFDIRVVQVRRTVNCKGDGRKGEDTIIIAFH